jgi:hypothetical protein
VSSRSISPHSEGNACRKVNSGRCGSSIAHVTGSPSTATGNNVAATMATAFQKAVIVCALVRITGSASTGTRWSYTAAIRVSNTGAFGSVSWTDGQSTGQTTGTTTMTCISFTPMMAITCTTADIPRIGLQSPFICTNGFIGCDAIELLGGGKKLHWAVTSVIGTDAPAQRDFSWVRAKE